MADLHWFDEWIVQHRALHRPAGLPEIASEEGRLTYDAWEEHFAAARVSEYGAGVASKRLVAQPPRFKADHFKVLLEFASEATRNAAQRNGYSPQHDLSTREGAEAASKGCPRCGGMGLATVEYGGDPTYAAEAKIPFIVAAYCVCALGRWIQRTHAERSKDAHARTPDLDNVIAGRSVWRVHPSSEPEWTGTEATYVPSRREINAAF